MTGRCEGRKPAPEAASKLAGELHSTGIGLRDVSEPVSRCRSLRAIGQGLLGQFDKGYSQIKPDSTSLIKKGLSSPFSLSTI